MIFVLVFYVYISILYFYFSIIYSYHKVKTIQDSLKLNEHKKSLYKTRIKFHLIMRVQVRKSKGEKTENLIDMLKNLDTMLICRKALIQCCRIAKQFELELDLGNGQFSERCDVDGSFFNSDAIPIIP